MNDAQLHLMVNHFPIIGTFFGLGILILGLLLKEQWVKRTAYLIFIVTAIFAAISVVTGHGAEEIVEMLPDVTKETIHEHEETAHKLALILYVTGLSALISMYFSFKGNSLQKHTSIITLLLALIAVFLVVEVGKLGGEIRHQETREGFIPVIDKDSNSHRHDE